MNTEKFPVIAIQQEIFEGFKLIYDAMDQFYEKMMSEGLVKDYKITFQPYNSGYEVKVASKLDYNLCMIYKNNEEIQEKISFAGKYHSIYLYPGSFYDENIEKSYGADITGRLPENKENSFKTHYSVIGHSNDEMREFVRSFVSEALQVINAF